MSSIKYAEYYEYKAFKLSACFMSCKGENTQVKFGFYRVEINIFSLEKTEYQYQYLSIMEQKCL